MSKHQISCETEENCHWNHLHFLMGGL